MADDSVTLGAFPEQVVGGYPPEDLVQWRAFLDAQRRALERFARDTADAGTVFVLGLAVPVQAQLFNAAAVVHRGRILGCVPKEKLPTYNVFYEARTFSRGGPGLALDADGVPLGDYLFALRLRHGRGRGLRGRVGARRPDAPPLPFRRRDRRQRLGLALPAGHRRHPPRDAGDARRRQPDGAGLRQRRRRPGRPDLRRRRLRLPERPAGHARGAALRRGLGGGGRRPRPHPAAADREHDLAGRLRGLRAPRARRAGASAATPRRPTARRCAYPAPPGGSFFLPAPSPPPIDARDAALDELFEALALGVDELLRARPAPSGRSGMALSGGRDSMLTLLVAWRAAARILRPTATTPRPPGGSSPRSTCRPGTRSTRRGRPRTSWPTSSASRCTRSPSTRPSTARSRRAQQMLGGQPPGGADASERPGAAARPADVELGQHLRRALPADRRHEREGRRLHDHRRRPRGRALGDRQRAEDGREALLARLDARFGFAGIAATLATRPGPELADAPAGRRRPDALPDPRRLPAPLRRREDVARRDGPGARQRLSRDATRPAWQPARPASRACSRQSIYKWVQSPLALHVGSLDLDRERALQMPVVQRTEW